VVAQPAAPDVGRRENRWCRSAHHKEHEHILKHGRAHDTSAPAGAAVAAAALTYRAWATRQGGLVAREMMGLLHAYDELVSSYWAGPCASNHLLHRDLSIERSLAQLEKQWQCDP
jgi:hypothetical protein